jgi:hypothetical protein
VSEQSLTYNRCRKRCQDDPGASPNAVNSWLWRYAADVLSRPAVRIALASAMREERR